MLFTLALVGTLLSAGLAVDLGGAYVSRANLSKAVDAAALTGARYAGQGTDADLKKQIENMALANYSGETPAKYTIKVDHPGADNTKVTVSGATKYDTVFARLAGIDQFAMQSAAEAIRYPLDMTIVLDLLAVTREQRRLRRHAEGLDVVSRSLRRQGRPDRLGHLLDTGRSTR